MITVIDGKLVFPRWLGRVLCWGSEVLQPPGHHGWGDPDEAIVERFDPHYRRAVSTDR